MIWRLGICFSCILATSLNAADVTGRVRLLDSSVQSVRKHQDYSGVVVWLEPLEPEHAVATTKPPTAHMEQRDKQFVPHVLAIQRGSSVYFPNFDPIFHSAFSNFNGQIFDLGLYAPGTGRTVTFSRPGIVRVFCNIHPTMSAIIAVLNSPYFTVSEKDGAFAIRGVAPGSYRLHFFHERASPKILEPLERTIAAGSEPISLPLVSISETGYVEMPHKNKYGQDYPPVQDEPSAYPARRK
jgi:plastocyanin